MEQRSLWFLNTYDQSRVRQAMPSGAQTKTPGANARGFCPRVERDVASEVIIDAEAEDVRLQPVVHAGDGEGAVAEIHVEVFDLGRPVGGKADFHAEAAGPAEFGLGFVEPGDLAVQIAVSQAEGAVDQDIVHGKAGAGPQRAEPRIGEFPRP